MEKKHVGLIVGLIAVVLVSTVAASLQSYEKFEADPDTGEERVYAECSCAGSLAVMESYPPQYNCNGLELCRPVNYTRKR